MLALKRREESLHIRNKRMIPGAIASSRRGTLESTESKQTEVSIIHAPPSTTIITQRKPRLLALNSLQRLAL